MAEPKSETATRALQDALKALAKRSLSRAELNSKLQQRGHSPSLSAEIVHTLCQRGILDEAALCEELGRRAARQARGPRWLAGQLQRRGVDAELATQTLEAFQGDAQALAHRARLRHFGPSLGASDAERLQQARYLVRRGFSLEVAARVAAVPTDLGDEW